MVPLIVEFKVMLKTLNLNLSKFGVLFPFAISTICLVLFIVLLKKYDGGGELWNGFKIPVLPHNAKLIPAFKGSRSIRSSAEEVEANTIFWHYLSGQQEGRQITPYCTDDCLSGFVKNGPLVLIVHGFGGCHNCLGDAIREGFSKRSGGPPVNMIIVNWSKLASRPDYARAANNVRPVGEYVAKLINWLVKEAVASLNQTDFIGYSLGAHVANHVSLNLNGGKMRTIFALDPAKPRFSNKENDEKLDSSDADFVSVIHTSSFLGMKEPSGHVDFFPNSGDDQPGCGFDLFGKCSHSRAYKYFAESLSSPSAFLACKCNSWEEYDRGQCPCKDRIRMGWDTPSTTSRGVYYLRTNSHPPYACGHADCQKRRPVRFWHSIMGWS